MSGFRVAMLAFMGAMVGVGVALAAGAYLAEASDPTGCMGDAECIADEMTARPVSLDI